MPRPSINSMTHAPKHWARDTHRHKDSPPQNKTNIMRKMLLYIMCICVSQNTRHSKTHEWSQTEKPFLSHEQSKSGTKRSGFNRKWLSIFFWEIPVEIVAQMLLKDFPVKSSHSITNNTLKKSLFVKNIKVIIASFQLFSWHMFLFVENPDTLVH